MSQLWLPTELWIKISTDNPLGLGERRSLVLVNKHFYEIFTPLLYSDLTFRLYISKFAKMAASHTSACYLTHLNDRLGTSDKFRSYVRNCRFILLNDCRVTEKSKLGSAFMYPLLEGIFEALANCPNLITVYLHGMKVSSHWIYRLAFSAQSIQLERCDILDAQPLPGPFTLKSLNIESSVLSALKDLVFSPSIEELQLSEFPSSLPHSRLIQGSLFGSLRRLHLEGFHDTDINALRYSHNLVDFTFDYVYRNETYSPEWKQLLPKLEKVTAYEQLIPLLITGRNITSIKVIYMSDYANLERWFGSNVAIRHIEAGAGIDVSDLVAYLAASNPEVETLSLLPLISMVTFSIFAIYTLTPNSLIGKSRVVYQATQTDEEFAQLLRDISIRPQRSPKRG